jgi:hypothetical protein
MQWRLAKNTYIQSSNDCWSSVMLKRVVLVLSLVAGGPVMADASLGEFMGYKLGDRYSRTADTREVKTATGNLLITAQQPVKPADIAKVTLLTTAETATIAYIDASQWFATEADARAMGTKYVELLKAKYPDWEFGREVMDANMHIVEVNLDRPPYNLRLRLTEDKAQEDNKWRFSMMLGWQPDSAEQWAWREKAIKEQEAEQGQSREQQLEKADTRGL